MEQPFEHTGSTWVRYSAYEWRECDGIPYLTPAHDATPKLYNPLQSAIAKSH